MTKVFEEAGVPSVALHGKSSEEERHQVKSKLEKGEIKMIFVVDLYNEGVDIPAINTILFLRPTESLTVFLQQLGRGLRLFEGKECLTVLDFIGQVHQEYNFQNKFRALIGKTKYSVQHYVENGLGTRIALFVREYKEENNYTSPFVFLGEAEYVRHEGNKPISFIWRLKEEMPPAMVSAANKVIV